MHDDPGLNLTKSQLSAFLDGELPQAEAELLIRRLERDAELRRSLASFALIGEMLRTPVSSRGVVATRGFAARVSDAIAMEDMPPQAVANSAVQPTPAATSRWLRPVAGLSIAAGVAAVAIGLMNRVPDTAQPAATVALQPQRATDSSLAEASYVVPEITVTGPLVPAARLTNYVMAHSEYSSPLGRRNVLSNMLAYDPTSPDAVIPAGFVPVQNAAQWVQP
jgi:sigma-E factor negative regulatory protein RseA